jgi:RND family efflux transporter MFP subunit
MKITPYIALITSMTLLWACSPPGDKKVEEGSPVRASITPQKENQAQEEDKQVPVRIMKIRNQDLPLVVDLVGRLAPNREVTLSAEVGGKIESYHADVGDKVQEGWPLIRINPKDYQLALKEAQANLAVAQTRLDALEKTFRRAEDLLPQKAISMDAFEKAEAEYKSAQASIAHIEVVIDIAKERLNKTKINAPFNGLISIRTVEIGQTVGPGQPLMTLADLNTMRIRVYLTEKDYMHLDPYDPVSINIEASAESSFKGRIDRIGIKADERTNTFDVEILIDNPDLTLKAGMTARVRLTTTVIRNTILIPQSTVLYRKDRKEVFVVGSDQRAEAREIELGRSEGFQIQILKGLNPGDNLIITGGQYLKSGDRVMLPATPQAES